MKPKALVSWSEGKDCILALWHAREQYDIVALLTTVTREFGRISRHGVRVELLKQQADSLGIPPSMAGPLFKTPIAFQRGEVVLREERFSYCDLLLD
jgi:diphthamide synthase (EF-2-diphthine--ammonia ligase)